LSFANNRKFLSANSSAKVNCASPFWREINDTWTAAPPPPTPRPLGHLHMTAAAEAAEAAAAAEASLFVMQAVNFQ